MQAVFLLLDFIYLTSQTVYSENKKIVLKIWNIKEWQIFIYSNLDLKEESQKFNHNRRMSALLFASRLSVLTRRSILPSASLCRIAAQPKSTYQYEYDKSFWQRYIEKRTKKIQSLQQFWGADNSTPFWWKTTFDKVYVILLTITLSYFLVNTLSKLYLIANNKL